MKKYFPLFLCLLLLPVAIWRSEALADGMRQSLALCAGTLIPSLFPLFVLARLLSGFGGDVTGSSRFVRGLRKLFCISPAGVQIFLLGLCGGYPLGAVMTAEARKGGRLQRDEAERILAFCNNSGPAFIIGAGGAAFQSPKAGILLYLAHILAAVCVGLLLRIGADAPTESAVAASAAKSPAAVFTDAVSGALGSCLNLSAYVCFFGSINALWGGFASLGGLRRVLALGFTELGSGIGALAGWKPGALTMALAGFLFGWGGVSVHFQTLGAVAKTDIKCARHLMGRALCGLIAAAFSALFSLFL